MQLHVDSFANGVVAGQVHVRLFKWDQITHGMKPNGGYQRH